ncbi:Protein-methionine sulfoxide oxidase mical2b [Bienertia sinuspersici]
MTIPIRSANKLILPTITSCSNNNNYNNAMVGDRRRISKPPIIISTNPSHINIDTLSNLYLSCNHSPHRFPLSDGKIDPGKLAVAVSHSSVVVSVFSAVSGDDVEEREKGLWERIVPSTTTLTLENGELVGFGRAVSDLGLFFAACGFGDDMLGSTTMMYAKTTTTNSYSDQLIIQAGRKMLVAPPSRLPFLSQKQSPHIAC